MSEFPTPAPNAASPPPLEWWRRPVYILFKLLPLIVLLVLVWNWITVTRAWQAARESAPQSAPGATAEGTP